MADLQVIFDPTLEMAAVINIDTRAALPIAAVGPNAPTVLQAFIDSVPFDITVLDYASMMTAFESFLSLAGITPADLAETGADAALQPPGGGGVADSALAVTEAAASAGEPPGAAPADTDLAEDPSPQSALVRCWNCEGAGVIEFGDGAPSQKCGMCNGTGKVQQTVPA